MDVVVCLLLSGGRQCVARWCGGDVVPGVLWTDGTS